MEKIGDQCAPKEDACVFSASFGIWKPLWPWRQEVYLNRFPSTLEVLRHAHREDIPTLKISTSFDYQIRYKTLSFLENSTGSAEILLYVPISRRQWKNWSSIRHTVFFRRFSSYLPRKDLEGLCDVNLLVGDQKLPAHSGVLAMESRVFSQKLKNLQPADDGISNLELHESISIEGARTMLTFLYGVRTDPSVRTPTLRTMWCENRNRA